MERWKSYCQSRADKIRARNPQRRTAGGLFFLRKDDPSNLNHTVVLRFVFFYGLYGVTLRFENVNIVPPQNVLEMDTGL